MITISDVRFLDMHAFYEINDYKRCIERAREAYKSSEIKPQFIMFFCNTAEELESFLSSKGFTRFVSHNYANHNGRTAFAFIKPIGDMFNA